MNSKIDSATVDISEFRFKVSVGDIVIPNESKNYKYTPKEDITPYEVSRLILLFYFGSVDKSAGSGFIDY